MVYYIYMIHKAAVAGQELAVLIPGKHKNKTYYILGIIRQKKISDFLMILV